MNNIYQQKSNIEVRVEGYWYSEYEPDYPMPEANVLTEEEAKQIHARIKWKEESAEEIHYRGFSMSRIESNVIVGSSEFITNKWRWPNGFADHYVLKHRVKPSDDFLRYIGHLGISDKEKAEAFEHICSALHYARIAMRGEKIKLVLDAIDKYCRAGHGEYSEDEHIEHIQKSFEALKKI